MPTNRNTITANYSLIKLGQKTVKKSSRVKNFLYPHRFKHDFYEPQLPRITKTPGRLELEYSKQMTAALEIKSGALWVTMHGEPHPVFNLEMLTSYISLFSDIENRSALFHDELGQWPNINYIIIKSGVAGTFSLGGDLLQFAQLIRDRDWQGLRNYAKACVDPLARFSRGLHLPLVTISLVQGRSSGGGFELPLAGDIIIAEKQATFALPEIRLNLFPGMGATSFLMRKVGERALKTIMDSDKHFTAQEMLDLGVIDQIVETGQGEQAVQQLIQARKHTVAGYGAMAEARRIVRGDLTPELMRIAELWVQTAMKFTEREISAMHRLARYQGRMQASSAKII